MQSENILRNAYKLFKEKGYKKTTTREISEASDINKGLLHYYYNKKEDIIFEMYSAFLNSINDFIDSKNVCKGDAFLYYATFNIIFFRTVTSREYFIKILNEIVEYRDLTRLKIEKSTEMLYGFLKDLEADMMEYHLLLAITVAVGAAIMAIGGIVLFIGSPWFATWFTDDSEAIKKIITALRIDTFAQIPLAVSLIFAGALQGLGDTKTPLYSTAIGMWGIRIIGVYLLGIRLNMDIAGIWLAILIDLTIRAVFLTYKFRSKTLRLKMHT